MSEICPVCKKQILDDWDKTVWAEDSYHRDCFSKKLEEED